MKRKSRVCGVPMGKPKKIDENEYVIFPWERMERKELIKLIKKQQKEIEGLEGELKNGETPPLEGSKEEQYKPDTTIVMIVGGVFSVLLFLIIVMVFKVIRVLM